MLSIRDHDVEDYAALRHMDTTDVGVLNEDDRECLREIGEYLVASDVWQRFGIWLLHKHFEPDAGEVFVERVIPGPRRTETRPADRSVFSLNGLNATAMRFEGAAGSGVGVVGMEFAEPGDFGRSAPLSAEDEAALAGIVERLEAHSKTDRFGVRLIRDPLELSKQEVMLETCDSANRTLHCNVAERDALPAEQTVETTWRWEPAQGANGPTVMQQCFTACVQTDGGHVGSHVHP